MSSLCSVRPQASDEKAQYGGLIPLKLTRQKGTLRENKIDGSFNSVIINKRNQNPRLKDRRKYQ
jgi:hypothetical protein